MEPIGAKITAQKLSVLDIIIIVFSLQTNILITDGLELGTSDACAQPHSNTHKPTLSSSGQWAEHGLMLLLRRCGSRPSGFH